MFAASSVQEDVSHHSPMLEAPWDSLVSFMSYTTFPPPSNMPAMHALLLQSWLLRWGTGTGCAGGVLITEASMSHRLKRNLRKELVSWVPTCPLYLQLLLTHKPE